MKIIRTFIAFIVISLGIGLGSAFNGQGFKEITVEENVTDSKGVEQIINVEEDSSIETDENVDDKVEEKSNDSFSASKNTGSNQKEKKVESSSKVENTKPSINTNTTKNNSRSNNNSETSIQQPVQDNSSQNNSTPKSNVNNDFYHSITKGRTEYESDSVCYAKGKSIQNKELDSVLDWNEQHPEELKQPIINYSKCYEIVKDGKSYWYLHFFTTLGEEMDDELKNMYR